jgi:hypothetical protein
VGQDGFDHVGVVLDAELIRDRQQERVGGRDGLVLPELIDELVRFGRVRAAEDRLHARLDVAHVVLVLVAGAEVHPVLPVDEREDRPAHRHAGLALVTCFLPRFPVCLDLLGLLNVERLAGLVLFQSGALQVHAELGRPDGGAVGRRAPPDAIAESFRMRLDAQQTGRIAEHRAGAGLRETLTLEDLQEHLGVLPGHVGVGLAFPRHVAEVTPAVDHLLG